VNGCLIRLPFSVRLAGRNNQQPSAFRRLAVALKPQSRHVFGNVIDRDFLTGFDDANGDIAAVAAACIGVTGVIDEPRGRMEQDVSTNQ